MIVGIGVDIVQVSRVKEWLNDEKFLKRFFNQEEIEYVLNQKACKEQSLAARFAAKEALGKAFGTGLKNIELNKICVKNDENGKPYFVLCDEIKKLAKTDKDVKIHLSISHEKEYAIAMVVLENE